MGTSNRRLTIICKAIIGAIILIALFPYAAAVPNCPVKCKCNQTNINCTEKQLTTVPDLKKLSWNPSTIDISENDIEDIKVASFAIKRLELVEELLLDDNSITFIEIDSFASLPSLKYLDLSNNLLDYVSSEMIKKNTKLIEINLSGNLFTSKTPQLVSESLQILDLSFSKISTFTEESLEGLPNLRALYLEANSLQHVDYNIFVDVNLRYIDLSYNCWKCNCDTIKLFDYLVKAELTEITRPIQCMHPNKWYQDIYSSSGPMHHNKLCKKEHHHRQHSADSTKSEVVVHNHRQQSSDSTKPEVIIDDSYHPKGQEETPILMDKFTYIVGGIAVSLLVFSIVTLTLVCRGTKEAENHYEELDNVAIHSKQPSVFLEK